MSLDKGIKCVNEKLCHDLLTKVKNTDLTQVPESDTGQNDKHHEKTPHHGDPLRSFIDDLFSLHQ